MQFEALNLSRSDYLAYYDAGRCDVVFLPPDKAKQANAAIYFANNNLIERHESHRDAF